jgi:serine phosphatase RsbU (regulator of sigma subunit)
MFTGLLLATHLSRPDQVATELAKNAARADLRDLVVFVVDLEQAYLVPLPSAHPAGGEAGLRRIEGTVAGRCFAMQQVIVVDAGEVDRRQLWLPLLDGAERVGVITVNVPAPGGCVDPQLEAVCERYAHLAAQLVMSKGAYGDAFEIARRRQPMSVAAELQRRMLPPLTTATEGLVITGVIEPCYHAGGDSFDYAVNGADVHLAVFDAMGHGLAAAATASVAVAAYRNGRRRGLDLVGSYGEIDETLRDLYGGERFASAVLARLDLTTGALRWVNAGHPAPLLIRAGRFVKVLQAAPSTALGIPFGEPPVRPAQETLEPGDRILLYTDGVIEARTPDGRPFSTERLVEFLERQSDADMSAPETLRRLRHAIMLHQHGRLQDDATVVLCEWGRGSEEPLVRAPAGP